MDAPQSVYIHVPFCRHRCGYCNFTLVAGRDYLMDDYLQAIERELSGISSPMPVQTIYLGGGTPSRLPKAALERLLNILGDRFILCDDGEFTMEANPDDLPGDIAETIYHSQINRISLGIQSFSVPKLRSLDRDHDLAQIEDAIAVVKQIVQRFSIDLIFAAPHDSPQIWQDDLSHAIETQAQHISTYELTYEKGTDFWSKKLHRKLQPTSDDICAEYYLSTIQRLTEAGYQHYEISSFAKAEHRSMHNQVYWSGKPFLAAGPGASGFVNGTRYTNHRSVKRYLTQVLGGSSPVAESHSLSDWERASDQLVFGLRLVEGIEVSDFQRHTGWTIDQLIPSKLIKTWQDQNLIEFKDGHLKLTRRGLLFADTVCSQISMVEPPSKP